MQPAAVLSILVRSQGVAATAGELGRLDKAGRSAGAGLQKTEGHAKRASKSFSVLGSTAKLAGITLGAAGLAKGLSLAVSEYREAQKVGAQTNAVLKSTGNAANVTKKQIEGLANAISLKSGIDDEAIQKGENLLLTFRDIRNETGKGNDVFNQATQAITDVSVAMDQGMKQSAVQVGKALNDPIKGMTALRRIGVTFTQGQVDMVKKLVDSGDKLGAQKLILRELNKEFAGSAAAQATAGDKLKVSLNNLAEAAGGILVPQLDKAAVYFTKMINAAVKGEGIAKFIIPVFDETKRSIADLTAVMGPLLEYLGPRLLNAFNALPAPIRAVTVAFAALGVVLAVSSPVMAGLAALAASAILIHRNWSTISPIINHVRDSITTWQTKNAADIAIVIKAFRDVGAVVRAVFQVAFPVVMGIAKRQVEGLRQQLSGALQVMTGAINVFLGLLHGDWSRVWGGLKDIAAGAIRGTLGMLKTMTAPFREVGSRIGSAVVDGLSMLGHEILNRFKDAANFVIKNVGDLFKGIGGAISKGVGKINPFGDGVGKLPAGGKGSAALMGASSALAPFANVGARFGLHVSSGLRPGARTSSGNVSYHSTGEAIDEAGSPAGMLAYFKFMRSTFGSRLAELIYTPGGVGIKNGQPFTYTGQVAKDHFDHVHVALDTGAPGPGDGIGKIRLDRLHQRIGDGLGKSGLESLWMRGGGPKAAANMAAAIALAESGGRNVTSKPNRDGTVDRGYWQINSSHGALSTLNPLGNARAAVQISSGGRNWNPWTTFRTGAYKKFLGAARKGAGAKQKGPGIKPSSAVKHGVSGKRKVGSGGFSEQKIAEINAQAAHVAEVTASQTEAHNQALQTAADAAAAVPGPWDYANLAAAEASLTPGTQDDIAAANRLVDLATQNLGSARASGDPRAITEAIGLYKQYLDALTSLTASVDNVAEKLDLQTKKAEEYQRNYNVSQSDYAVLTKALASIVSGEIGGRTGLGFMTPGFAGGGSRY